MKRTLSLFMVLCLLISLSSTLIVSAAPNEPVAQVSNQLIDEINITGVVVPVAGQTPTVEGVTCGIPGVTVSAEWFVYNYESRGFAGAVSFENGNIYRLDITLTAEQPTFEWIVTVTANDCVGVEWYVYDEQRVAVRIDYALGVEPVTELNITGIGDTSVGAVMTTRNLQAEVAYVEAGYWLATGGEFTFEDGVSVFEDGKIYVLDTYLYPKAGYYFAEDMFISFEGRDADRFWGLGAVHANVGLEIRHVKENIGSVYLLGTVPEELCPGTVPLVNLSTETEGVDITEVYWTDGQGTRVTTIEEGKCYYLNVALSADEGYRFTEGTYICNEYYEADELEIIDSSTCVVSFRYTIHVYDNDCDSDCNNCGATRDTSHVYDNACDTDCNVCGATRDTSHAYDNDCDPSCNVCGATRIVFHVYDNVCDTDCNNCGATRDTSHVYDNDCDPDCNVCGAIRTVSHSYGPYTRYDKDDHARTCSICGDVEKTAHRWDTGVIVDPPTEGETSSRKYTCLDCTDTKFEDIPPQAKGDLNADGKVNNKDVEYLLWHTLFPDTYPVSASVDFDGNGKVNNKDVEYLLWHTLFPGSYPLN